MTQFTKVEMELLESLKETDYFKDADPAKSFEAKLSPMILTLKSPTFNALVYKESDKWLVKIGGEEPIKFLPGWAAVSKYIFHRVGKEGYESDEDPNLKEEDHE